MTSKPSGTEVLGFLVCYCGSIARKEIRDAMIWYLANESNNPEGIALARLILAQAEDEMLERNELDKPAQTED